MLLCRWLMCLPTRGNACLRPAVAFSSARRPDRTGQDKRRASERGATRWETGDLRPRSLRQHALSINLFKNSDNTRLFSFLAICPTGSNQWRSVLLTIYVFEAKLRQRGNGPWGICTHITVCYLTCKKKIFGLQQKLLLSSPTDESECGSLRATSVESRRVQTQTHRKWVKPPLLPSHFISIDKRYCNQNRGF